MIIELPSQEYLKECLIYNEMSGVLTWNTRPLHHFNKEWICSWWNGKHTGNIVGNPDKDDHLRFKLNCNVYYNHRIIWKMYYGVDPIILIDHKDGNPKNNRIINLREANLHENQHNRKNSVNNKSGYKGVSWKKDREMWRAIVSFKSKNYELGCFNTPEEANEACIKFREKHHGEFANNG